MAKNIEALKSIEDAIREYKWLSDAELSRVEQRKDGGDVERLVKEYRLCRALLGQTLGQRRRLMELDEGEGKNED